MRDAFLHDSPNNVLRIALAERRPVGYIGSVRRSSSFAVLLLSIAPFLFAGSSGDPGLLLELDRESYVVRATDLRSGVEGPPLRVALGSPRQPTPRGSFPLREVVRNPDWDPGPTARAAGATYEPPSDQGTLGVAKIPFSGSYSLHGGARGLLLGKPITLGCLRSADPELLDLLAWLTERGALGRERESENGERRQYFMRPARLVLR